MDRDRAVAAQRATAAEISLSEAIGDEDEPSGTLASSILPKDYLGVVLRLTDEVSRAKDCSSPTHMSAFEMCCRMCQ